MTDTQWPNAFRQRLIERERLIGCWASLTSPFSTELLGGVGFDWILLDAEHAPNDLQTLGLQLMALKDSPSAPVVRPQWTEPVVIKRLLDLGANNFLMPFVQNADEAARAVAATRYPPAGNRGVAMMHRANRYGMRPDYFGRANESVGVIVQIETGEAVANAASIAAVPGVDALFVGPADLSSSLGHFVTPTHPEVQAAIAVVVRAAREAGKSVGILAPVAEQAERYLEQGMNLVAVGSDAGLLRDAGRALSGRFKK